MSEKAKNIFKRVAIFAILIAVSVVFAYSLAIYHKLYSPIKGGQTVSCSTERTSGDYTYSTVEDVIFNNSADVEAKVKLTGTVSYSSAANSFYLRDGAFIVPLNLSGCINTDILKDHEVDVFVKGAVARTDIGKIFLVDGIKESAPVLVQHIFNTGVWGLIGVFVAVPILLLLRLFLLIGWLLVRIGLRHPEPKPKRISTKVRKDRNAKLSVAAAGIALINWFASPILGICWQGIGLYTGWKGLRSSKRVAVVGIALSAAGLIITPIVFASIGLLSEPPINFAESNIENFGNNKGIPTLTPGQYVNEELGFSMRLPWGWSVDEKSEFGSGFLISAPKGDSVDGQYYVANMIVAKQSQLSAEEIIQTRKTSPADWMKNYEVTEEGTITADGQTVGLSLGYTYTYAYEDKDMDLREFQLFVTGKGYVYIVTATLLNSAWSVHEKELNESFATFLTPFDFETYYAELVKASTGLEGCIEKMWGLNELDAFVRQLTACQQIVDAYSEKISAFGEKYDNDEIHAAEIDADTSQLLMKFFGVLLDIGQNDTKYSQEEKNQKGLESLVFLSQVIDDLNELAATYSDTDFYRRSYPQGITSARDGVLALLDALRESIKSNITP